MRLKFGAPFLAANENAACPVVYLSCYVFIKISSPFLLSNAAVTW